LGRDLRSERKKFNCLSLSSPKASFEFLASEQQSCQIFSIGGSFLCYFFAVKKVVIAEGERSNDLSYKLEPAIFLDPPIKRWDDKIVADLIVQLKYPREIFLSLHLASPAEFFG